jgi:hypothetical protein
MKTNCIVVPQDQLAGQNHNIKIGNTSFERVNSSDILEQP